MNRCAPGTCKSMVIGMVARHLAEQAVENAVKAALAEVRPYISDRDTLKAVNEALLASKPFIDAIHKE